MFDIPVVLFTFKRLKVLQIIERIKVLHPKKIYIISDNGRTEKEKKEVDFCRKCIEEALDWNCEVIKNYAEENRGVYENIAEGAKWVLKREKWAIFLEDDNLPELSFFSFCEEILHRYENDNRVLWICGTNYLGEYFPKNNDSYVFTRHMLPCGWASWSHKFEHFYDGQLSLCEDETVLKQIEKNYFNKSVYKQYYVSWMSEYHRMKKGEKPKSWDYQMDFSIKAHGLYGICPIKNQIKNIGVDDDSIHGGNSLNNVMTRRFCGMNSYELEFPLKHPDDVSIDPIFEKKIAKIILYPLHIRIVRNISVKIKKMMNITVDMSLKEIFRRKNEK